MITKKTKLRTARHVLRKSEPPPFSNNPTSY